MHYYKRNTGDWLQATIGYSYAEQGILLRLIDIYHIRETGIPDAQVERLIAPRDDAERAALRRVLDDHFMLERPDTETQTVSVTEPTWINEQCERDIAAYRDKASTNRENGRSGGRPRKSGMNRPSPKQNHAENAQAGGSAEPKRNPQKTQSVFSGNPNETLTTNLETNNSSVATATDAPAKPTRAGSRSSDGPKARRASPAADSPQAQALTALLAETVTGLPSGSDDTPRGRLWREGLATLARLSGKPANRLRSLLGRMRDDLAAAPGIDDPDTSLLALIERADAEQPSEPIPWIAGAIRARHRPPSPCANDDAEAWAGIADGVEFDKRVGRNRPVVNNWFIDVYARDVCEAAGLPQTWRGDWSPLVGWLRDDIDFDGNANIVSAIRRVAARPGYQPPASLAYFDAAVRGPRPVAAAG